MNGRKVSVILPVYNGEDNIAKAIDSVLKQTYKNIELVIVNDCSTDHTQQILDEWAGKDTRIKLVMNAIPVQLILVSQFEHVIYYSPPPIIYE